MPTPTLPIGGGAVRSIAEKFTMNPATGAGSMAIAVPVPPGRSGFGPSLTLSYDSSTGNGPFGVGWNLTVPSISRKTDKGLPRYRDQDESDTFVLSGAEDLVPYLEKNGSWSRVEETTASVTRYRYRPRTEGDHARILRIVDESGPTRNVYWEVTTSDNVTHTYGKSAATRIAHPDHPQLIFRWLLEESRDQRGNVVRYEYKAEDLDNVPVTFPNETQRHEGWSDATANRYLKRIFYGNVAGEANPTTAAHFHFEVVFDYGEHNEAGTALPSRAEGTNWPMRQDPFSSHRSGFEIRTYRLCRRILVFHTFTELQSGASTPVAALELEYDEDPVLSHLTKATHRGYDATEHPSGTWELALPSVELSYSQPDLSSTVQDMDPDTLQSLPTASTAGSSNGSTSTARACPACSASKAGACTTSATSAKASSPHRRPCEPSPPRRTSGFPRGPASSCGTSPARVFRTSSTWAARRRATTRAPSTATGAPIDRL
ncbi:MAG: SpvB/TcaC N-terminal domain-containing protein [Polyangiaceae bacterium]